MLREVFSEGDVPVLGVEEGCVEGHIVGFLKRRNSSTRIELN
jgi:hypothetical protein